MKYFEYAESILESTNESYIGMAMDLRFDIIDFVKNTLEENDITQGALALKMNMKEPQLTRIMNAESNITLETVARIFQALDSRPTIEKRHESSEVVSTAPLYYKQNTAFDQINVYRDPYIVATAV